MEHKTQELVPHYFPMCSSISHIQLIRAYSPEARFFSGSKRAWFAPQMPWNPVSGTKRGRFAPESNTSPPRQRQYRIIHLVQEMSALWFIVFLQIIRAQLVPSFRGLDTVFWRIFISVFCCKREWLFVILRSRHGTNDHIFDTLRHLYNLKGEERKCLYINKLSRDSLLFLIGKVKVFRLVVFPWKQLNHRRIYSQT